ncbi:MAG: glycosyltransferase family 32 protein [Brevinema sp.]
MSNLRTLHRIYFGFDGKPDQYAAYLKTWEEKLPGYTIKHWNAENLPVELNTYTTALYKEKDHAFLSDYFRWWLLREYGGIYLDSDIEIINSESFDNIIQSLENSTEYSSIIGIDTHKGDYTAHSMACKKGADLACFMCELYESMGALRHWRRKYFIAPDLVPLYFLDKGFLVDDKGYLKKCTEPTLINDVMIYPKTYFSPIVYEDYGSFSRYHAADYSKKTVICHHYGSSWCTPDSAFYGQTQSIKKHPKMLIDYVSFTSNGYHIKRIPKIVHIFFKIYGGFARIFKKFLQYLKY